jgi:hypothetical protein
VWGADLNECMESPDDEMYPKMLESLHTKPQHGAPLTAMWERRPVHWGERSRRATKVAINRGHMHTHNNTCFFPPSAPSVDQTKTRAPNTVH